MSMPRPSVHLEAPQHARDACTSRVGQTSWADGNQSVLTANPASSEDPSALALGTGLLSIGADDITLQTRRARLQYAPMHYSNFTGPCQINSNLRRPAPYLFPSLLHSLSLSLPLSLSLRLSPVLCLTSENVT